MIIVRLMGGLGNQMFQYALGRTLSIKNSEELKLDNSDYRTYKLHNYGLNVFKIKNNLASKQETEALRYAKTGFIEFIATKVFNKNKRHGIEYYAEKSFKFDSGVLELKGNRYLDGYWQSEKYFLDNKDIIRSDFKLRDEMNEANKAVYEKIMSCKAVSYHIRRGDYVSDQKTNAYHGVDLNQYYKKAVNIIKERVDKPHFFIFSDEPEWVKANFKGEFKMTVVDCNTGKNGYDDMRLMSACRHNIIANSSFSWWGAWLNPNPDKIVTAPKNWFRNNAIDTSDLIPETWIMI